MTIALVVVAFVAGIALIVAAVALFRAPGPPLRGRTVIVHTKDDRTLRGILHGEYTDRLTIRDASIILPGGREQTLGGVEHVPRSNVSFIQEIEAAA